MADIKLTNIVKRYDNGFIAVKGINLAVKDKEFMVLVGPSGCGKTTCLRMIAGLEEVTEGDLYIGTRRVNDVQPKDRDIAMVFQSYALYPHMTVYENMAFGLKLAKVPRAEIDARVQEAARMLKIVDKLETVPRSCPAACANAWPWVAPSCASPACSFLTSRCPTWTPSCAPTCAMS